MSLSDLESWFLGNVDTGEQYQGQFPAEEVAHEVGATYGDVHSLNRQSAITQFLHGNIETLSLPTRLYAETAIDNLWDSLKMLLSWVKRDESLQRPPVLLFWIGDATVSMTCLLESVSGITYHSFRDDGSPRDVSFTLNLREFVDYLPFETGAGETRYHRARLHDYYEWLTQREYGDPMLGVVIRDRHPTKGALSVGDVVKLPDVDNLRTVRAEPTSIAMKTSFGRRETDQRNLRLEVLDRLNTTYYSHILKRH